MKSKESFGQLAQYQYSREIGAYRPHFQGIPDTYYPLNCCQICLAIIIVVVVILIGIPIGVGLYAWRWAVTTEVFIDIWCGIGLGFMALVIILFYIGGKDRRVLQKKLIAENTQRQKKLMNKNNESKRVIEI